jgi:probable F420-dependent oxidoreductase
MKLGFCIPNNQGVEKVSDLVALAREAEQAGFHSAWVSEHLFNTAYVAKRLGNRPYHEALTVLTAVAAATTTICLGTSVLVLPWHHPVRLAKTVASLDEFSRGRVILGVGVGITRDEYNALGVSFSDRGDIANECLAAMAALWTQDMPEFVGRHFNFSGQIFSPKPHQKEGPPVWIGGNSDAAKNRLIRYGSGWHPLALSPDELSVALPSLQADLVAAGRSPDIPVCLRTTFEISEKPWNRPAAQRRTLRGTVEELIEMLLAYKAAGATHIVFDANSPQLNQNRALLTRVKNEIAPYLP